MTLKSTLLVCLIILCHISHVTAVSECTSAIVASVFGTIAVILFIVGIAALVWYCRLKRSGKLSSRSSVESASEPEISLGTKAKGGQVGLNGHGTPVTFSHHYKEEAPSAAYNTKGVVNPAFGGQREVFIDMPSKEGGEVKIDMDGDGRFELPSSKEGEVKIDMGEGPHKGITTTKGDINLEMDIDFGMNVSNGSSPKMSSRDAQLPDVDFYHNKPSDIPGADTDLVFEGSSIPTFDVYGPKNMETIDVDLDRPESGGFGLLIARDKTLPPPALFVREVTPGGVAARTGLVDKGDKIVGINGTIIEGLAHDKAMRLLRNDDQPRLKLTLLKNSSLERNGSLDLPVRSLDLSKTIDESCTADAEPGLKAGIPSLDVEGLQGSADLGETETSSNISEFDGHSPQVRSAGPNMKPPSLQGSLSNLNLPSPKSKRAKCFSCLSKGDRGEPYSKGNTSDRLDWDRQSADRSSQGGLKAQPSGPNVDASAGKFKGSRTSVDVSPAVELSSSKKKSDNCFSCTGNGDKSDSYKKTMGNVGINLSNPDGSTEMVEPRSVEITASAPNFHERGEPNGLDPRTTRPGFDIEGPNKGISTGPPEISLHAKDPTIKTADVSIQSGNSDIGLSRAGDISSKLPKVEIEANSPDTNGPKGKLDTDISVPDVDISHGDLRGPRAQIEAPSGKLNLPSSNRKRGNCLSCAGDADKDDPYRKTQGSVDYNLHCPDGSLEMEKPGKLDISASTLDFQGREETKDLSFNSTGPNFDVRGPNNENSTKRPEITLPANDPSVGTPDVSFPSGDTDIGHSGPGDIYSKRPKIEIEASSPHIDDPKGRFDTDISAQDADMSDGKLRGPGAQVNAPSAQLNVPSVKKKRGTCLSCAGDGDKDDPYRKSKGNVGYDFSGPDGSMEMEKHSKVDIKAPGADFQGHAETNDMSLKITKPDTDIERLNRGISTGPPEICLRAKDPGINSPDVSFPSGSTNVGLSGAGDISSKRPEVEIEANSPDIDGPKGRFNPDISAPGVDVSQGELRGSTAKVHSPSEQLNVPSTKRKGVNCFSCAGDGDKDDQYKKTKRNVGLNLSGADGSLMMEKPRKAEISASAPDFQGCEKTKDPALKTSGPHFDNEGPNKEVSTGPSEISLHAKDPSISTPDTSFPSGSTNIDLTGTGDISSKRPKVGIEANSPDIDGPKGKFDTETSAPDADLSLGKIKGPKAEVNTPSGQLNLASTKRKGGNCLSCAGDGDKDEPYRKSKGNFGYDFSGPEKHSKVDIKAPGADFEGHAETNETSLKITKPDFDIEGPKKDIPTEPPEISLHPEYPSINNPEVSFPSGSTDISLSGAGDISSKRPEVEIEENFPDRDGPKARFNTEISAPGVDVSQGKLRDPTAEVNAPSRKLNVPSTKRKGVNCLSCAGDGDKDEPYRKSKGGVGLRRSGPDRSLEMETPKKVDIKVPEADFQEHAETNDMSLKITKPDSDNEGPNWGISTGPPEMSFHAKDPSLNNPDISSPSGSTNIGLPGAGDISSKRTEVEIEANSPDIDGPKGRFNADISAPSVDLSQGKLRGPTAEVNTPSRQLNLPSKNRKGVNCLSCAGDGDKGDPYKKTKENVDLGSHDGLLEMVERNKIEITASAPDFHEREETNGLDLRTTGTDFDIEGPNKGVSTGPPEISLHVKDPSMNTPHVSTPLGSNNFGLSGAGDISSKRPKVEIEAHSPDIDGPEGRLDTHLSAPDADVSHGKLKGPRTQVDAPSEKFNLPSTKRKGVNCLSCAGDGDKDDPYRKTMGSVGSNFSGPDGSLEIAKPRKVDITASAPDFQGRDETKDLSFKSTEPDFDVRGPNKEISTGMPKISYDAKDPDVTIPSGSTDIGFSGAGDISSKRPTVKIDGNSPVVDGAESRFDTNISAPDAEISTAKLRGSIAQVTAPSGFSTGPPEISLHGKDPSLNIQDVSIPSGDTSIGLPGAGDVASKRPIVDVEANSTDIDEPKGRFEKDISAPDVHVAHGPKAEFNAPSRELNLPASKKKRVNCLSCAGDGEKDDPYRKTRGSIGFNLNGPNGSMEVENPSKVDISISGPDFDGSKTTTGLELSTITPDMDIQEPKNGISLEPSDISENSLDTDTTAEKFKIGLSSPEFKDPKIVVSELDAPKVSYQTPGISGPLREGIVDDTDVKKAKLDLDTSDVDKPDFESETPGRGAGIRDVKISDFSLSGPSIGRNDKDVGINEFDVNINASRVSAEKPDTSNPSFDASASDIDFEGVDIPSTDLKLTGLDIPKPGGKEIHFTKPDIFTPSVDGVSVNTPAVDLRQRLEADMKGLDVESPASDFTIPSPNKKRGSLEPVDMKGPEGKSFEGDVDWGISTSTPKDSGGVKCDADVVKGDIEVVETYDNMELNSKPEFFSSVSYDEPRSLQRYDEIRPEMELRLLPPTQPKEADPNFKADIPDANLDLDNWKPREMSLVKVEENVTVCSASVLEPSSPGRTLTLDREITQKIELELPGHQGLDTQSTLKKKSRSSSSSSSSSDIEDNKEKKSKLLKVFRKNSNSSASSKESSPSFKTKTSERKSSESSSSSDDDDKDQNRPSTDVIPELNLKSQTRSSSSSSNEGSFGIYHHDLPKIRRSKKSSSSSDEGKENYRKRQTYKVDGEMFTSADGGIEEPGKSGSLVFNVEDEVRYNLSGLDGKISSKEKKPITSFSTSSNKEILRYNVSELNNLQKAKDQANPERQRGEDDLASSIDLSHHQYKVVENVVTHDFVSKAQDTNLSVVQEDPFVILSRSFKGPYQDSEREDELKVSSIEVQFSEPSVEVSNFLDYPCRVSEVEEDDGARVQEEGVVPTFKSRLLEYDIPDVLVQSEPSEENNTRDLLSSDQKGRMSPAWDIQAHIFENVSHVTIRDDPSTEDENNEIREQSLIVVTRSLKRTSPIVEDADDGMEEKPLNFSNNKEIQFNEPTHDFHLEYPGKKKVFTFEEQNDHLIGEERISQHTKEREIPDISAQLDALNYTEHEPLLKSDSPKKAEDHDKSPKEESPKEIARRGSNSRLWDLMQGYLIEQPILSDDATNSESRLKNTEEHNKEGDQVFYETKVIEIKDRSVSEKTQQSLNVVTYQIHIDDHQSPKDLVNTISAEGSGVVEVDTASKPDLVSFDTKPVEETRVATSSTTSITKVENRIAYVTLAPVITETDLESDAADQFDLTKDEYHTSVTDVKSSVQEVRLTSHSSQIEPISLHVDVGAIKPVSKYQTTSWKKEISVPADVDDENDDPWMRHYSRGLQQGTPYKPLTAKSPGRESSLGEKSGLSLSKVPHVKGIKTSVEKQHERPRYSIEGRTGIQSASYHASTDSKSMPRELETVPRVRTPESLLSGREDREQSEKSQPESAGANPSKGTSTSSTLVQSLRSFWDK